MMWSFWAVLITADDAAQHKLILHSFSGVQDVHSQDPCPWNLWFPWESHCWGRPLHQQGWVLSSKLFCFLFQIELERQFYSGMIFKCAAFCSLNCRSINPNSATCLLPLVLTSNWDSTGKLRVNKALVPVFKQLLMDLVFLWWRNPVWLHLRKFNFSSGCFV